MAQIYNFLVGSYQKFRNQYGKYQPALFFTAGFVFDLITLSRVDDPFSLGQQFLYTVLVFLILRIKVLSSQTDWKPQGSLASKIWQYHDELLHFLLGSLLSLYALLFFMSSSLASSIGFLFVMFAILVANELPILQKRGLFLKTTIFALCLYSFLTITVGLAWGRVGPAPFYASILAGVAVAVGLFATFPKSKNLRIYVLKQFLSPMLLVGILLVGAYTLRILPPIPLSIQHIGIYHGIEKRIPKSGAGPAEFELKYDRPFWKFWQKGAQSFTAYADDRIICFVRIFSPSHFRDQIFFRWSKKGPKGWESQDRIPIAISGGRDEGFRGFAIKTNFESGEWRVQVETIDEREVGRINFEVEKIQEAAPADREFRISKQ